ncbi:aminotransferase class V-fold PLP-dependent enzyme [Lachnoclostridium sp. Marseille-P6806]|uniref:aminotransferase class V-fold PLP-dependent enzyme n=1 Tax=Lachnoclostridium sp. Marseille-P6806 TaxID=2364793 RepID=UPI0010316FA4|nr:SufS family cysteine desulfurase [Lachnoclostridium sp. Marseille-P6806]
MNSYRSDFPIFQGNDVIYFDNAATTQRPAAVFDAMKRFNDECNANPLRGLYDWSVRATERYEQARHTVAELIGAARDCEIVFTRNTTESINLIAYSYGLSTLHEGDEIAVSIMEHHSNQLPWRMAAERTGAKIVWIECEPDGTITREEYQSKITERTRIVALTQVSNVLGSTNPIREIADYAHGKGAVMVVDGAQSTPHMPVDVRELGADFFVFSGHKLMGPMGIGVLYGRISLLNAMPPFLTGGEMIESVTRDSLTYAPVPEKFEAGTVNALGAVGLAAAIRYLQDIGFEDIMERERQLTQRLMDGLSALPEVKIFGQKDASRHCGIVTFEVEGCHPHDVASVLDTEHICIRAGHHCAQPLLIHLGVSSTARASLYFYNTEEEVDRFVQAVSCVRRWMGY